jgi:hypothetical protein
MSTSTPQGWDATVPEYDRNITQFTRHFASIALDLTLPVVQGQETVNVLDVAAGTGKLANQPLLGFFNQSFVCNLAFYCCDDCV